MKSCRFYTPPAHVVESHDGLDVSPDYEFDRPFTFSSCACPDYDEFMCGFEAEPYVCDFYKAEEDQVLRQTYLENNGDAEKKIVLISTRVRFGIREYMIRVETFLSDVDDVILHRINAHEAGEDARELATELYEREIKEQERSYGYISEEVPVSTPPVSSYLSSVVSA